MSSSESRTWKVVVTGDTGVGKTALLHRYFEQTYVEPEVRIYKGTGSTNLVHGGLGLCEQQVIDASGQSVTSPLTMYFRNAAAVIYCFDCTNPASFLNTKRWYGHACGITRTGLLLATKCDISASVARESEKERVRAKESKVEDDSEEERGKQKLPRTRQVSREEGEALADSLGLTYFETSALEGFGISSAMRHLVTDMYRDRLGVENISGHLESPDRPGGVELPALGSVIKKAAPSKRNCMA